jgi:hypothetical protein
MGYLRIARCQVFQAGHAGSIPVTPSLTTAALGAAVVASWVTGIGRSDHRGLPDRRAAPHGRSASHNDGPGHPLHASGLPAAGRARRPSWSGSRGSGGANTAGIAHRRAAPHPETAVAQRRTRSTAPTNPGPQGRDSLDHSRCRTMPTPCAPWFGSRSRKWDQGTHRVTRSASTAPTGIPRGSHENLGERAGKAEGTTGMLHEAGAVTL